MMHSVTGLELIMWGWQWRRYWKNSMPFIELRSFVIVFTGACHWTLFWSRWIQCALLYQISSRCTYFSKEVSFLYDGCQTFCMLFSHSLCDACSFCVIFPWVLIFPQLLHTWLCFVTCLCNGIWVPLFWGIGWPSILLYARFNGFLSHMNQIVFFRVFGRWWWCWWFYGRSIRECPRGTAGKISNQWSRFSQWTEQ